MRSSSEQNQKQNAALFTSHSILHFMMSGLVENAKNIKQFLELKYVLPNIENGVRGKLDLKNPLLTIKTRLTFYIFQDVRLE